MSLVLFFIFLVIFVIVLSAIISCSEAAILSISYTKAKEILSFSKTKSSKIKAEKLILIKENIQKYITTIVVLNNIVNIIGSIYIGVLASSIFGNMYLGLISAILTFLIIMFSEIIPKIYGEKYSQKISLKVAPIIILLTKIFLPINFILNKISSFFIKGNFESKISEGEIKEMAKLGLAEGSINNYEGGVIENVFKMNDTSVYDIMVPKNKVVGFNKNSSYTNIIEVAQKTGFTRFPIFKNNEIVGLINVKDLFRFINRADKFKISKIIRPIIFAPEGMKIFKLEENLKKDRIHMAVIVNEYGDFTGIVSLEDILEELLGEIEDEFDKTQETLIEKVKENKYLISGACEVDFINERFEINLTEREIYNTLNGYLIYKLGKIPKVNETVKFEKFNLRIVNTTKKKVLKVELFLKN